MLWPVAALDGYSRSAQAGRFLQCQLGAPEKPTCLRPEKFVALSELLADSACQMHAGLLHPLPAKLGERQASAGLGWLGASRYQPLYLLDSNIHEVFPNVVQLLLAPQSGGPEVVGPPALPLQVSMKRWDSV